MKRKSFTAFLRRLDREHAKAQRIAWAEQNERLRAIQAEVNARKAKERAAQ